jgi:hypothetical protein
MKSEKDDIKPAKYKTTNQQNTVINQERRYQTSKILLQIRKR